MDEREKPWPAAWIGNDLYAFVEHREPASADENGATTKKIFVLDVVPEHELSQLLSWDHDRARAELSHVPTAQIVFDTQVPIPAELDSLEEGTWHLVRLSGDGRYPVTLYRDVDGVESANASMDVGPPLDQRTTMALASLVSLAGASGATPSHLSALVGKSLGYTPLGLGLGLVTVVHVGQGNCNAVCDAQGMPVCYFDFGGGCLRNAGTFPSGLEFCFTCDPPIILSHWDFDHWFSGTKSVTAANATWVAPNQLIGVRTRKFAANLIAQNRLWLWPGGLPSMNVQGVEIIRCTGITKNDSGLALAADVEDGVVVCPGDAEFGYMPVPTIAAGNPVVGLVATHHGAAHMGAPIPKPAPGACLAFSYGIGNSYNHPNGSRGTYRSEGWTLQFDSPAGNIALGGRKRPAPCGGGMCSMGSIQP